MPLLAACVALTALFLVTRLRAAGADPSELVRSIGTTLAYPIATLVVVQIAAAVTLHHLATSLACSCLAVLLCVGTASATTGEVDVVSGFGLCLLVGWCAGVVTAWLLHDQKQRLSAGHVMPGGRGPRVLAPALLAVAGAAVGLLALALLPDLPGLRFDGSDAARSAGGGASSGSRDGSDVRSTQSYLSGSMDLNARGDLPTTELVAVPAASPSLWAASQMDLYDGRSWSASGPPSSEWVPRDAAGEYDLREVGDGLPVARTAEHEDVVRPLDDTTILPVLAPGQAAGVRIDDHLVRWKGSLVYPTGAGRPYVVRSNRSIVDEPTVVDLALPASVPQRVRDLAVRLTGDEGEVHEKVAAVEAYLRASTRYRLDSPVPGDGEDAVDHFLFESREGFCEHYAAAEVVLLRAVGIPARVVTGFAGGTFEGDSKVFRGSDAHAWVQVHVGENRWMWSDPTAGSVLAEDEPSAAAEFLRRHWLLLVTALVGVVLVGVGAALVIRWVRARRAAARAAAAPLAAKVLAGFGALESALARTALARRPDLSVEEWQRVLVSGWPGGLQTEADRLGQAFAAVQRVLYDRTPLSPDQATAAIAALDTLTTLAADVLPAPTHRPLAGTSSRTSTT
jgi:transglutaminase-like putative cysteine protease